MGSRSLKAAWPAAAALAAILLAQAARADIPAKALAPIPAPTLALMAARNTDAAAPILIRAFKKENELEVWKRARDGRFVLIKTYPICRWSGQLGPKVKQGDRQTPEGFYSVAPKQMNPNSAYYLSFDTGFPNAYDKARGASGSALMVHGTCSSAGCYAMTDPQVAEIYALARDALAGGQKAFQFQAFPFRMTARNIARHRLDPHIEFWRQLKEGSDRFEATGEEPSVGVAGGRYVFAPSKDPAREALAQARLKDEEARTAALIADGSAAIRTTYSDGGQHPTFAALAARGASLGQISRPEALALAGREITIIPARPKPPTQLADAKAASQLAGLASASRPSGPTPAFKADLSLFEPVPLGYGRTELAGLSANMSGSMRIMPAVLADMSLAVPLRH
jgi:murein L,D-transpeptidase YafK